jgi:hypothetical protein
MFLGPRMPGALSAVVKRPGHEAVRSVHLVLRSRGVELYFHSPMAYILPYLTSLKCFLLCGLCVTNAAS